MIWGNYSFFDRYLALKIEVPASMDFAIDENIYTTDHYSQNADGTFEETGPGTILDPYQDLPGDDPVFLGAYNADLDADGKLTIQEAHVFQVVARIGQLKHPINNITDNMLLWFGWILMIVDAIGLGFVVSPWLKKT
mgnify:FL=1